MSFIAFLVGVAVGVIFEKGFKAGAAKAAKVAKAAQSEFDK